MGIYWVFLDKELVEKVREECGPDIPFFRCIERCVRKGVKVDDKM